MDPVRQFKFACPVCGQHLQARAAEGGQTTECPSCFKKLKVPHAPTDNGSKLIITAALADTRRSKAGETAEPGYRASAPASSGKGPLVYLLPVLVGATVVIGGVLYLRQLPATGDAESDGRAQRWTDEVEQLTLLEDPVVGRLNGWDFEMTTAFWRDAQLILRQNGAQPEALRLQLTFPLTGGELVPGKTFRLGAGDPPFGTPPRIVWRNESGKEQQKQIHSGYVLWVKFDEVSTTTVSGRIHMCMPDVSQSWIAGSFSAQNRTKVK